MEKRADVRTVSSVPGMSARKSPSSRPPIRSMALRDRVLRSSVWKPTRCTCQTSKAWPSMRSLASVFTGDRCADAANHVYPMSTTSGTPTR